MKKCRSRIIFNRENQTAMKNEIGHNHSEDPSLYDNFVSSAVVTRHFGKNKSVVRSKAEKAFREMEEETEN
jgi:hypothetical protein